MLLTCNEFRFLIFHQAFLSLQVSALSVLSVGRIIVLNAGDSVTLECWFSADQFNLFNHPVMWRKRQRGEDTPMNIMSNLHEPFIDTGRFAVSFSSRDPLQYFELKIRDLRQEDSGNYTCEVRGPHAILLGHVSYILHIRAYVDILYLTTTNATASDDSTSRPRRPLPSASVISLLDTQYSTLRCVTTGSYQSPEMSMYLDGRDVTGDFSLRYSTELSGVKGLRQMRFTTELFTYSARFSSTDDGRVLQCIAAVPGLPANATSARLNVQYVPQFSCETSSAFLGDSIAVVKCAIRANPRVSSSFWLVDDNGTILRGDDVIDNRLWTVIQEEDDVMQQNLYIRNVEADSFRRYSLIAENDVGSSTCFVTLHREFKSSSRVKEVATVNLTGHMYQSNTKPNYRVFGRSRAYNLGVSKHGLILLYLLTVVLTLG